MFWYHLPLVTFFAATQVNSVSFQLCTQQGIVKIFETLPNDTLGGNDCRKWFFGDRPEGYISLQGECITGFENGWFRVGGKIDALDLSGNKIGEITKEMLDSLEPGLQKVDLKNNKIKRITRGTIDREDVLWLDLSYNSIQRIEIGALEHVPNLQLLNLTSNQITDVKFVASLPIDVTWLYLNHNAMTAIPDHLLSSLPNLEVLELAHNNIRRIGKRVLEGIFDLYYADFSFNPAFQNESAKLVFKEFDRFKWGQ